ncbi:MAG: hemolysin family protein [Pikeienuella sp.]
MDASDSPETASGDNTADKPGQSGIERPRSGLLKSLVGSLVKGSGRRNGATDANAPSAHEAALGPAFRDSTPAERTMVANILRLRELRVEGVMTPRADIVAVPVDASLQDVMAALSEGQLSRVPVYQETLDDPLGFVHLKDLALAYGVGCLKTDRNFALRDHLRMALFVPPSMRIVSLMQRMQAARTHMALVIDEFGGVDGLVTIEDLVEQVVGDIEDEHDTAESAQWRSQAPGIYIVNARADIREFSEAEGVALLPEDWEEDVDTLGGLVFMLTGRVPTRGEVITHPAGHEFEVIDADPRRIRRMRLTVRGAAHPTVRDAEAGGAPAAQPAPASGASEGGNGTPQPPGPPGGQSPDGRAARAARHAAE